MEFQPLFWSRARKAGSRWNSSPCLDHTLALVSSSYFSYADWEPVIRALNLWAQMFTCGPVHSDCDKERPEAGKVAVLETWRENKCSTL